MVDVQVRVGHEVGPAEHHLLEAQVGFHNRGVTWDTSVARLAGSGQDSTQKWRTNLPKKTEAILSLVLAIRLSPFQTKKQMAALLFKKEKRLDPLVMVRTIERCVYHC